MLHYKHGQHPISKRLSNWVVLHNGVIGMLTAWEDFHIVNRPDPAKLLCQKNFLFLFLGT